MLGVLASYSITVKELKMFFSMLRGEGGLWVSDSMVHMQLVGQKHMLCLWYDTEVGLQRACTLMFAVV